MKKKYTDIRYSKWETPLLDTRFIDVFISGVLQAIHITYFFMYKIEKDKEIFVLSIPHGYPYRVMDEEYSYASIRTYFDNARPMKVEKRKKKKSMYTCAWKFWHTDMIKELDRGEALTRFGYLKRKDVIHYVIDTGEAAIEFISPEYRWEIHQNIKVKDLIQRIVKNRFREQWEFRAKKN